MKRMVSVFILMVMLLGISVSSAGSTVTRQFSLTPYYAMECGTQQVDAGNRQFNINITSLNYSGSNPTKDLHAVVYSSNGIIYERHFDGTGISQRSYSLASSTGVGLNLENEGTSNCSGSVKWNAAYR